MIEQVPADFPSGVDPLEFWSHRGVPCAVGSVGSALYGLARLGVYRTGWTSDLLFRRACESGENVLTPQNLGNWVALAEPSHSGYWSSEVLSRLGATGSSDFAAWDVCGHTWEIEKIQADVNAFVDSALRDVPTQRGDAPSPSAAEGHPQGSPQ